MENKLSKNPVVKFKYVTDLEITMLDRHQPLKDENLQERPNYRLTYRTQFSDDYFDDTLEFRATNDQEACRRASQFIKEQQAAYDKNRKENPTEYDGCRYKPISLARLDYVVKEVIEETAVPWKLPRE